jgi:hypothetical protein
MAEKPVLARAVALDPQEAEAAAEERIGRRA